MGRFPPRVGPFDPNETFEKFKTISFFYWQHGFLQAIFVNKRWKKRISSTRALNQASSWVCGPSMTKRPWRYRKNNLEAMKFRANYPLVNRFFAGCKITIFNRNYIDSIRVHFPASYVSLPECTLPENKWFAPENGWLEDDPFLSGWVYFQGLC